MSYKIIMKGIPAKKLKFEDSNKNGEGNHCMGSVDVNRSC